MRLAAFIRSNIEQISAEWEIFAATLLPEEEFSASILRDGIVDMLNEIVIDIESAQTAEEQQAKSEGEPRRYQYMEDAAERHALARVKMGLSSRQLISEFRALRATVIRLWQHNTADIDKTSLYDLTRFNEAVDQALTEAAVRYSKEIDYSRELFLGILGHDLRTPLAAISSLADLQLRGKNPDHHTQIASQILICAGRMTHMITDLIELTRVRLGSGILIKPIHTSLRRICMNVVDEMKAIYPERSLRLNCGEEYPGNWDEAKMTQVLSNLLGNAIQHGNVKSPITVTATTDEKGLKLLVHNEGAPIPPKMIPKLFDCLFQGRWDQQAADDNSTSLGLGLYIASEIISAHKGTIEVQSSADEGTSFIVRLTPRHIG